MDSQRGCDGVTVTASKVKWIKPHKNSYKRPGSRNLVLTCCGQQLSSHWQSSDLCRLFVFSQPSSCSQQTVLIIKLIIICTTAGKKSVNTSYCVSVMCSRSALACLSTASHSKLDPESLFVSHLLSVDMSPAASDQHGNILTNWLQLPFDTAWVHPGQVGVRG